MVSQTAINLHYKVDISYHVFFALAAIFFNATWSKHCGKVQKYTFKVQTFKVQKHTFKVQKYTFEVQKYTFKVHKYTHLQLTKCSEPGTGNCKTCRNPLKPGGPGSQNWFPGTAKPVTRSRNRFPEPGSFPERPQLAQNAQNRLKSILCKDPIAFYCWWKNKIYCNYAARGHFWETSIKIGGRQMGLV